MIQKREQELLGWLASAGVLMLVLALIFSSAQAWSLDLQMIDKRVAHSDNENDQIASTLGRGRTVAQHVAGRSDQSLKLQLLPAKKKKKTFRWAAKSAGRAPSTPHERWRLTPTNRGCRKSKNFCFAKARKISTKARRA